MNMVVIGALVGAAIGAVPAINAREPVEWAVVAALSLFCASVVAALMMVVG